MVNESGFVSVVMPIFNEVSHLRAAIDSLLAGGYPNEKLEFVLVDGGSTDGTLDLIEDLSAAGINIKLLENKKRITPHALNIGIQQASHDIIIRADAHALYLPGYIDNSVRLLKAGNGDNVGGQLLAMPGETMFSRVLALVLNSKLGNGGAKYRTGVGGKLVDTVWCGCWYKSTLLDIGLFDVEWITNQDAELNARLRTKGYTVYSDFSIRAKLVVRPDFGSFFKQYYRYGAGRFKTFARYPLLLRLRQVIPFFAVFFLLLGFYWSMSVTFFALLLAIPLCALGLRSQALEIKLPTIFLFWAAPILVAMNIAWVMGFLIAAIKKLFHIGFIAIKRLGLFQRSS